MANSNVVIKVRTASLHIDANNSTAVCSTANIDNGSVLKLSINKGIIKPEKTEEHEVKRINGISALTKESYYKSGNSRPIT